VSSSSSTSELDVEQSSSSDKTFSVLPKLDHPVWKTGPFDFPQNLVIFEHLIALLDLDHNV
jgi:hypothetical protein